VIRIPGIEAEDEIEQDEVSPTSVRDLRVHQLTTPTLFIYEGIMKAP
jgi:hypothetical protein